jgi:hypothetical protein
VEAAKDNARILGNAAVYFYCQSEQRDMLKGSDLLASYIKQLLLYLSAISKPCPVAVQKEIRKFFGSKRSEPDFDDLAEIFSSLLAYMPKTIYIVDGLDELKEKEAERVLRVVRQLFGAKGEGHGSRILIFSRDQVAPYLDVARFIPGTAYISTSTKGVTKDIQLYVESIIDDKMSRRELTSNLILAKEIKQTLLEKASGMYVMQSYSNQALPHDWLTS